MDAQKQYAVANRLKKHAYGTTCIRIFLFVGHSNRHNHLAQYQVGQEVACKPVDHFVGVNKMVYRCRTVTPVACNSVPRQAQLIEYQRQQNNERQVSDLTLLAERHNWSIAETFTEKVSGAKKNEERKELTALLAYVRVHNINKVLVTELSRLGRDTLQVLTAIEKLNKAKVSLYIMNYNIETLTHDGKINPMSQFMITILAEVARMERKTIKERMESGYNNFRANNGKVGRKTGYRKSEEQFLEQYKDVIRLLKKGVSLRDISNATGISVNTVRKCKTFI